MTLDAAVHSRSAAGPSAAPARRGFTLVELLVVIAVISVLASLLFPVFARARESARSATCLSNLRQIGQALSLYRSQYEEYFPTYSRSRSTEAGGCGYSCHWTPKLKQYAQVALFQGTNEARNETLFVCPSSAYRVGGYAHNLELAYLGATVVQALPRRRDTSPVAESDVLDGTRTVLVFETPVTRPEQIPDRWGNSWSHWSRARVMREQGDLSEDWETNVPISRSSTALAKPRHSGANNILFVDGHVRRVTRLRNLVPKPLSKPDALQGYDGFLRR